MFMDKVWPIMKWQTDEDEKSKRNKRVKINVVNFSEGELEKRSSELKIKKIGMKNVRCVKGQLCCI